ncbi:DUF5765 domain-containing protein [Roseomonas rosulenta]|uniref:DUF5765 domain-containing protein n=1 Tax=Roseomonas rosulenta TaxID=2748667 RepID=UPI0018DF6616|nr:DUF5765 domain-containing protein [Roseomonas rosulenta]
MCWSMGATVAMVGIGTAATAITIRRRDRAAIPATLAYFTLMEALQVAGYATVDRCGTPANEVVALLSYLHIVFQPFFINAFAMALLAVALRPAARVAVWICCGLSAVVMLMQLQPFSWAGQCEPGSILCGPALCVVSGSWHIAWEIPTNDLLGPVRAMHWGISGFPTYGVAAFLVPLAYGAWRFVLFHIVAGPFLAWQLTQTVNEIPAVWCLFSIGIVLIALSPWLRARFTVPPGWATPRAG